MNKETIKKIRGARLDNLIIKEINILRKEENRSFSNMMETLILEAILTRKEKKQNEDL